MAKKISLDKNKKEDIYVNTTRPDLTITYRPSGSFIIRDGKLVPNLNDDAMMEREKERAKKEMPKENSEENKME